MNRVDYEMGDPVRCNQCMSVFTDDEVIVKGDVEFCPKCGEAGALMDTTKS